MKVLLVTEKCNPNACQRDGGARLVDTIQKALGDALRIMQFGPEMEPSATWRFDYPFDNPNRFERRLEHARFIGKKVQEVQEHFTHIIFVHVSMQFGLVDFPLKEGVHIWTFPMFLSPSYRASGEVVPEAYDQMERQALAHSQNILTPSYLEKKQLMEDYSVPESHIHVVPRGIDMTLLVPEVRFLCAPLTFCSIGSIKPQKNTLGLLQTFQYIREKFPGAKLCLIGPIQDEVYGVEVCAYIKSQGLNDVVELAGPVAPDRLGEMLKGFHFHLSASTCETFGRSIFETLASGLPNIVNSQKNAAAEFLESLPYVQFVEDGKGMLNAIEEMLPHFSLLSSMAMEIGRLYNDTMLSQLLVAKICNHECMAVSDFDGTLYHKNDPERTQQCMQMFRQFPLRVLCSARSIEDLKQQLEFYDLTVDWIIGCSGSIVTDGLGRVEWIHPLDLKDVSRLEKEVPQSKRIEFEGQVLQITASAQSMPPFLGLRMEIYQNQAFVIHWKASKLHAVHRLLQVINWSGQVCVFGDG